MKLGGVFVGLLPSRDCGKVSLVDKVLTSTYTTKRIMAVMLHAKSIDIKIEVFILT